MTSNSAGPSAQQNRRASSAAKSLVHIFAGLFQSNMVPRSSETGNRRAYKITDCIISISLVMYAVFAPHSISITQGVFLVGLAAWIAQMAIARNFKQRSTTVDIALLGFFACCVISSFLSYEPVVSIKGLRSPAFFLAFYFITARVRSIRFACFLAFLVITSCIVNVGYSAAQIAAGRGLRIDHIKETSPLANKGLETGDIIIEAEGQKVDSDQDLYRIIDSQRGLIQIKFQRAENVLPTYVAKEDVIESPGAGVEKLGITTSAGRRFRVTGFYSHYETYAEVLQLIAALTIGMLIAYPKKKSITGYCLAAIILLISATIVMTSTRAAMIGLGAAAAAMAVVSLRRRAAMVSLAGLLIMVPAALIAIGYSRGISVFDTQEGSAAYRLEVWREAFSMIKDHPLTGIGKGSEGSKGLKKEYKLYHEGDLPPGHFHSTPIQIATWWGLPALILYSSMMTIFACEILKMTRRAMAEIDWRIVGIALGGLGVLVAFNVSSIVHFNFGDGEVVMAFWLLIGLVFASRRIMLESRADPEPEHVLELPLEDNLQRSQHPEPEVAAETSVRAARARRSS